MFDGSALMKRLCLAPACRRLAVDGTSYCAAHASLAVKRQPHQDTRPSAARRGYGHGWKTIRAEVLRAHGIPKEQWHLYDVDHRPAYNPDIEPDHRKYQLVPLLHGSHSRKTIQEDGGFGNKRKREGA